MKAKTKPNSKRWTILFAITIALIVALMPIYALFNVQHENNSIYLYRNLNQSNVQSTFSVKYVQLASNRITQFNGTLQSEGYNAISFSEFNSSYANATSISPIVISSVILLVQNESAQKILLNSLLYGGSTFMVRGRIYNTNAIESTTYKCKCARQCVASRGVIMAFRLYGVYEEEQG